MEGFLDSVGDLGFTLATIGANLFVVLYSVLARFWRSGSGIHIYSFMLVMALILDHAAILLNFGPYPGSAWVRAILYPGLGIVIFWRVFILLRVQILVRKDLRQRLEASVDRK